MEKAKFGNIDYQLIINKFSYLGFGCMDSFDTLMNFSAINKWESYNKRLSIPTVKY